MRILVADSYEIARSGLRLILERRGWKVVAEASDGQVAVQKAVELQPDVAILEYELPTMNGAYAARQIRDRVPGTEVLIFTDHDSDRALANVYAAGALGYLLKSEPKQALYTAVESMVHHQPFFASSISERMLSSYLSTERADQDPLTPKERLIVQLVAEGKSNKQAARILNVSVKTVETHRASAMAKLDCSSTAELVRYAVRAKLTQP
jgi:DNA-binding NarL/FixJ family response regulator